MTPYRDRPSERAILSWPNVVRRQGLWALAGILMMIGTFAMLASWPAALLGLVDLEVAAIVTAVVLLSQTLVMRAARSVTARQIEAEEEFVAEHLGGELPDPGDGDAGQERQPGSWKGWD